MEKTVQLASEWDFGSNLVSEAVVEITEWIIELKKALV